MREEDEGLTFLMNVEGRKKPTKIRIQCLKLERDVPEKTKWRKKTGRSGGENHSGEKKCTSQKN